MVFLSFMMFSKFEYPELQGLQLAHPILAAQIPRRRRRCFCLHIIYYWWMPAVMFVSYLLYGFLRPFISRAWRREIEEDDDESSMEQPPPLPPEEG